MTKLRQTQHRPPAEGVRSRELNQVKQENKQLKRKVARLQRLLEKRGPEPEEALEPTLAATESRTEPVPNDSGGAAAKAETWQCPNCGCREYSGFATPTSLFRVCTLCKHRMKVVRG